MEGIIIVSGIVALVILAAVAAKFNSIAQEKGHSGYFWWCFLLGPAGWAMVIALPDRKGPHSSNDRPQPEQGQGKDIHDEDLPEL